MAWLRLENDADLRRDLSEKGRRRVKLSWNVSAGKLLNSSTRGKGQNE